MTEKKGQAKLREIKKALRAFPAEVRRQERAYRHEMKVQKEFGKLSFDILKNKQEGRTKGKKKPGLRMIPFQKEKSIRGGFVSMENM